MNIFDQFKNNYAPKVQTPRRRSLVAYFAALTVLALTIMGCPTTCTPDCTSNNSNNKHHRKTSSVLKIKSHDSAASAQSFNVQHSDDSAVSLNSLAANPLDGQPSKTTDYNLQSGWSYGTRWTLSPDAEAGMPSGYTLQPLSAEDYDLGYLDCLSQLTKVGEVSRQQFLDRLAYMQSRSETYMPIVVKNTEGRVVAAGTLVIEYKFIHQCGSVGHVEDIVVLQSERGRNLGRVLMSQLKHLSETNGSYKVILDCDVNNEPFYTKNGFEVKGTQMCKYVRDDPKTLASSPKNQLASMPPCSCGSRMTQ